MLAAGAFRVHHGGFGVSAVLSSLFAAWGQNFQGLEDLATAHAADWRMPTVRDSTCWHQVVGTVRQSCQLDSAFLHLPRAAKT